LEALSSYILCVTSGEKRLPPWLCWSSGK